MSMESSQRLTAHRAEQCQTWNSDRAHQVQAGRARATQFTVEHQRQAGRAAWSAFSARFWAQQGLAPLSAEAVRPYLSPNDIGHLGRPIAPELQQQIYRAWCAGTLQHVSAWLSDDLPPEPDGLWALVEAPSPPDTGTL